MANLNWYFHFSDEVHGDTLDSFSKVLKSLAKIQSKLCDQGYKGKSVSLSTYIVLRFKTENRYEE